MATWNGTPNATKNNVTALTASATPEHSLLSSHAPGKRKKLVSWRFSLVWEKFYKDQEEKKKMQRSLFLQTDNHIHTHVCTHSSWRIFRKERNTHTHWHTHKSLTSTAWRRQQSGEQDGIFTLRRSPVTQRDREKEREREGGEEGRKEGSQEERRREGQIGRENAGEVRGAGRGVTEEGREWKRGRERETAVPFFSCWAA